MRGKRVVLSRRADLIFDGYLGQEGVDSGFGRIRLATFVVQEDEPVESLSSAEVCGHDSHE